MSLINFLTRIHFADRVLEDALPVELARLRLTRVLLVTDEAGGAAQPRARLEALLDGECEVLHLQTRALAPVQPSLFETGHFPGAQIDGVIGFGGPKALCLALQVSMGRGRSAALLPMISIPLTSASVGLFPPGQGGDCAANLGHCVPNVILCDPTLTLWSEASVTVDAAFEALSGCLESYLSSAWNPPADGIALDGIARIADHLPLALANGSDVEARRQLLAAGLNAGLAGQKGRGAVAALVRALQRESSTPAGAGALHAALLPAVLRFNAPALGARTAPLAHVLRLESGVSVDLGLERFLTRHGKAARLRDIGIEAARIDRLARLALEDPATGSNPRLASERDYRELLQAAY